jgi:hypothetical protein
LEGSTPRGCGLALRNLTASSGSHGFCQALRVLVAEAAATTELMLMLPNQPLALNQAHADNHMLIAMLTDDQQVAQCSTGDGYALPQFATALTQQLGQKFGW